MFFLRFLFSTVLTEGAKMFLHVNNGRLNFIPRHPDSFSNCLWGAFTMQFKSTVSFHLAQRFRNSPEELDDRFLLVEHTIKSSS